MNQRLARWVLQDPHHRISYMINNNRDGVIKWLNDHNVSIEDTNADGTFSNKELYLALIQYAKDHYPNIRSFADKIGNEVSHNDAAPKQWNFKKG